MMLPLNDIFKKYNINPTGVLHLGASEGQERDFYKGLGVKKVVWIEAIPEIFEKLKENIKHYSGQRAMLACLSNEDDKEVWFNISSNHGQSSSLLELGVHKDIHPDVSYVGRIKMTTRRIDTLFCMMEMDFSMLDFLNIDLQGAELLALEGMGKYLQQFKSINIEVNKVETYINCPTIDDIDYFLLQNGFERVETGKWVADTWTDAFYLKAHDKRKVFKEIIYD